MKRPRAHDVEPEPPFPLLRPQSFSLVPEHDSGALDAVVDRHVGAAGGMLDGEVPATCDIGYVVR